MSRIVLVTTFPSNVTYFMNGPYCRQKSWWKFRAGNSFHFINHGSEYTIGKVHKLYSQMMWFAELISICLLINFIGVLYIVFGIKETKPRVQNDIDKELSTMLPLSTVPENSMVQRSTATDTRGNMCSNLLKDCVTVIVRKRSGNGRKIVYLILVIVGLSQALDFGMAVICKK